MDDDTFLNDITITRDLPFKVKLARFFIWTVISVLTLASIFIGGLFVVGLLYVAFTEHFTRACWVAGIVVFVITLFKAIQVSETHNMLTKPPEPYKFDRMSHDK